MGAMATGAIREMLVAEGWRVKFKRVYCIWRREGLKVPSKQPKTGPTMAQRRIVRSSEIPAAQPRLVV